MRHSRLGAASLAIVLAGCMEAPVPEAVEVTRQAEPGSAAEGAAKAAVSHAVTEGLEASAPAPEGAPAGTCWAQGSEGIVFETPCGYEMTSGFISSVQRALEARGGYDGAITGKLDGETRAALEAWQGARGTATPVLMMRTALQFGLVPQPPGGVHDPGARQAKAPVRVLKGPTVYKLQGDGTGEVY